jgi:di-trans,poly-cis-decaprenylcistransferase
MHIGFIVDGNRRWARERGLPTLEGHRKGFNQVEKIATYAIKKGAKFVSFYLFSTENWNRSEEEVGYLMDLLRHNIKRLTKKFKKENIRCVVMGRRDPVPEDLLKSLDELEAETEDNTRGTVCVCFNYGGHWELADTMTKILKNYPKDTEVTPEIIEQNLYHPEVPACDLIVRTSGEERISGFQLWRASYSEFLFLDKYFPEFTEEDFDFCVTEFEKRGRRFGV